MKRAREREPDNVSAQRVAIDVGGTKFLTTVSTIVRSTYLAGMVDVAAWEDDTQQTPVVSIFLDRDPEIFSMLLRLMRQFPHVVGLLPHEPRMCASLLAEADFFGFDALLQHVKAKAYYNSREPKDDYPKPVENQGIDGEAFMDKQRRLLDAKRVRDLACRAIDEKFRKKDEAHAAERFDAVYGSIGNALANGVLPKYFLEAKPLRRPPKKRIVQLLPVEATTWFLVGDTEDAKYGEIGDYAPMLPMEEVLKMPGFVRRVSCYALIEDESGRTWVEAMVHLTASDQKEWMCSLPGDGQGIIYGATLEYGSLEKYTGGSARRTMLVSDWLDKAVVHRVGHLDQIGCQDYWTHLLVAEQPPEEHFFSRAEGRADYGVNATTSTT